MRLSKNLAQGKGNLMAGRCAMKIGIQVKEVNNTSDGQRIDNFLIKTCKGVPKSRIYRAIRSGEVRVNSGRVRADSRIYLGDKVRIPPLNARNPVRKTSKGVSQSWSIPIVHEDDHVLVVNKPAGLAVHAGTRHDYGLIEIMQDRMGQDGQLQLVHRLDLETSGCLLLAKSRKMLLKMHSDMASRQHLQKQYKALVRGNPKSERMDICIPLGKTKSTDHRVKPDQNGRDSHSILQVEHHYENSSLLRIDLITGRMHQARVHCSELGFPIAGDQRYGDSKFNKCMESYGLNRLFLHADRICFFDHDDLPVMVNIPLPEPLLNVLDLLQTTVQTNFG